MIYGSLPFWADTLGTHPIFYLQGIRRDKTYAILCWRSSLVHRNYRDCYDYLEQHHQLAPRPFDVIGVEVAVQLKVGVLHLSLDIPEDSKQLLFFTKPSENNSQDVKDERLSEHPTWKGGGRGCNELGKA